SFHQAKAIGTRMNSTGGSAKASPPYSTAARWIARGVRGRVAASSSEPRAQAPHVGVSVRAMTVIVSATLQAHGPAHAQRAQHREHEGPGADHGQAGHGQLPALGGPLAELGDPVV